MIKNSIARLMRGLSEPNERENNYMDFDASLDLLKSISPRDIVGQAICATIMLRRAVTWCEYLGGDKAQIVGFVRHALDGCPDCDLTHAKEIWNDLDSQLQEEKRT